MLRTKPVLKKIEGGFVQDATGRFDKQIKSEDLIRDVEKFIYTHRWAYQNAEAIEHEINTRGTRTRPVGKETVIQQSTNKKTGVTYNIFFGKPTQPTKENSGISKFLRTK